MCVVWGHELRAPPGLANKELLLNLVVPLLVEPAPLLLGPLSSLIKNPLPLTVAGGAVGALALLPIARYCSGRA